MSYRNDEAARTDRANALISEIADLERQKLGHAATEQRLEDAKRDLLTLQGHASPAPRAPGAIAHAIVFGATASVAYLGYTLLV